MVWPDTVHAIVAGIALGATLALALLLTFVPRLGRSGRAFADVLSRAPMLDLVISLFTWAPWVAGGVYAGWWGVAAVVLGQIVAMLLWIVLHEAMHLKHVRGPRIVKFMNRTIGRLRNQAALWLTVPALPIFLALRIAELSFYPLIALLVRFPRYRQRDWVNVSRQKFEGLVGHDLIWCLYCDWMTGVYSLGGEMLRNVESYWCPIRFYDGKKCENCRSHFPDIDGGWTPADGTMADAVATMERFHGQGNHAWFGHPTRLTVNGQTPAQSSTAPAAAAGGDGARD